MHEQQPLTERSRGRLLVGAGQQPVQGVVVGPKGEAPVAQAAGQEFARAARWGKQPLDRGAAAALAGTSSDVRTPVLSSSLGAAAMPV